MYTTIERVRTLSGFDDTTNITDENVKSKIITATGEMNSAIGYRYSLPVLYRYQNKLTFSGTGSGSGTLAIIINGTTYNVSVAAADSASDVADKFRIAVASNTDFYVDDLGTGAVVAITSIAQSDEATTAYGQVNITSAADGNGITTTIGTRQKNFPSVLEELCAEIATARLFIDEYGVEAQDTGKDGPTRLERINETLQKLQGVHKSGQAINIFDDYTHEEIGAVTTSAAVSYPNDTSETDPDDPTSPRAWMNQEF